jgi:hypothetical protein
MQSSDWGSFGDTCEFETLSSGVARMDAPALVLADGEGITMSYEAAEGAAEYEVQFRSETDSEWKVASTSLKGTALRKKVGTFPSPLLSSPRCLHLSHPSPCKDTTAF